MGIWDGLRSLFGSKFQFGTPWAEGQYVNYVTDRDGDYQFVRLSLGSESAEGWQILVETKLGGVQTVAVLLAADPGRNKGNKTMAVPIGQATLFGENLIHGDDEANFMFDPISHATAAMNLIMIRNFGTMEDAVKKGSTVLDLPFLSLPVVELSDPWPEFNYVKVHDMSERVYITGLARTRIEGSTFTQTVTAFGCNNPAAHSQSEICHLDFEHPYEMDHGSFKLTYPGTWFFGGNLAEDLDGDREWNELYMSLHGGNTAALALCVSIFEGDQDSTKFRMEAEKRFRSEQFEESEDMTLRSSSDKGGVINWTLDLADEWKKGVRFERLLPSFTGEKIAIVSGNLVSSLANPLTEQNIKNAEAVIPRILDSFVFKE